MQEKKKEPGQEDTGKGKWPQEDESGKQGGQGDTGKKGGRVTLAAKTTRPAKSPRRSTNAAEGSAEAAR